MWPRWRRWFLQWHHVESQQRDPHCAASRRASPAERHGTRGHTGLDLMAMGSSPPLRALLCSFLTTAYQGPKHTAAHRGRAAEGASSPLPLL